MAHFHKVQKSAYAADRLFDLVADVQSYPEFLPLCTSLHLRQVRDISDGRQVLVADMTVAYKVFRETFTSQIILDRAALKIMVSYIKGPFTHLENRWIFRPLEEGKSEIDFFISYQMQNPLLQVMLHRVVEKSFLRFSEAFEKRAEQIYGIECEL